MVSTLRLECGVKELQRSACKQQTISHDEQLKMEKKLRWLRSAG